MKDKSLRNVISCWVCPVLILVKPTMMICTNIDAAWQIYCLSTFIWLGILFQFLYFIYLVVMHRHICWEGLHTFYFPGSQTITVAAFLQREIADTPSWDFYEFSNRGNKFRSDCHDSLGWVNYKFDISVGLWVKVWSMCSTLTIILTYCLM